MYNQTTYIGFRKYRLFLTRQITTMKPFLYSLLLFSLLLSFAQEIDNEPLGHHKTLVVTTEKSFQIDSRIEVMYKSSFEKNITMTNYLCFDDTVVFIQQWNDNSLHEQACTLISEQKDSTKLDSLLSYFNQTYGIELNYSDGITGILELKDCFGFYCGPDALPQGLGKKYHELREANLTIDQKYSYLSSINPLHALIGYLLFSDADETFNTPYKSIIKHSQYKVDYCYGCGGCSLQTIEDILKYRP